MEHPTFLLGQNWLKEPDNFYLIHLEKPKFLIKGDMADLISDHEILWLDPEPDESRSTELVNAALKYYEQETFLLKTGGQKEG